MKQKRQRAFTLIELVIVIAISSVVVAIGSTLLSSAFHNAFAGLEQSRLMWQSNVAFNRMAREIRLIRSTQATDFSPNTSSITFTTVAGDNITYAASGTTLTRNGTVLANYIDQLVFAYFDENGFAVTSSSLYGSIRYVQIQFNLLDTQSHYPVTLIVGLRNT